MRLPAATLKKLRQLKAHTINIPAPVAGWNARDSLARMSERDAVRLINWFPRTTYCEIRGGAANHLTALPTTGKTLLAHNAPSGSNKMFVSTDTNIYDSTSAGAVGASVAVCTSGKWRWLNYAAVSGTTYLITVNGVDKPFYYDGATWVAVDGASTPALTGLTTTKITGVNLFKQRLFFLENDKMNFWYLPVQQAGGALVEFVLGSLAKLGGFTMAMGTWTIDAGEGVDDHAVFVTSEGEAIIFKGTDPGNSAAWSHIGTFFVGKPLGRNCLTRLGGDIVILVEGGVFPLSKALLSASIDRSKALTDKISKAFLEAVQLYGVSTYGWQALDYTAQGALIVNIPVSEGLIHKQYVMNTISLAWCEFNSWNAESFLVFNGQLYYTGGKAVVKAWTGNSDAGAIIVADVKTAFSYLGTKNQKKIALFRPLILTNGSLSFNLGLNLDYEDSTALDIATYTAPNSALWDTAAWDVDLWQPDLSISRDWRTPAAYTGFCASALLRIATSSLIVQWVASDFSFTTGEVL